MANHVVMAAAENNPPLEESQLASQQQAAAGADQAQQRSKKQQKKKGKSANAVKEEIPLTASQAEHVRIVRIDPKKDSVSEERACPTILLSKVGRAPQLQLSEDRLTVTGWKGYRTVRATHGVFQGGAWYCEVTVAHLGSTGHVRLGWCTTRAELQAPIGFDKFGYCFRDLEGSKVHVGLREPYGKAYGEGDVIGLLIHLPDTGKPHEVHHRSVGRYKGNLFLVAETEEEPEPLEGSQIAFMVNGELQGVAYTDIFQGTYYPAASLYTMPSQTDGAAVTFNFGPDFKYPPVQVAGGPPAQAMSTVPGIIAATVPQTLEAAQADTPSGVNMDMT